MFLFQLEGAYDDAHSSVELSDDELKSPATTQLEKKDALYLKPDALKAALSNGGRIARDLNALLKISTMLSTVRELAELDSTLVQTLLEAIPAERGAILHVQENSEEVVASYGAHKTPSPEQPIRISRSVVKKVMRERVATLCVDVRDDQSLRSAESLFAAQVVFAALRADHHSGACSWIYLSRHEPSGSCSRRRSLAVSDGCRKHRRRGNRKRPPPRVASG